MASQNSSFDKEGCAIYAAGSVLAFMIAVAKGGNALAAILFGWLYVVYAIIELIFGQLTYKESTSEPYLK